VGAEESGIDEFEFARRRLTAAAYGFSSWGEFREWRKRNPSEYRERSRRLLELSNPAENPRPSLTLQGRHSETATPAKDE
jgi:hypothetical protein